MGTIHLADGNLLLSACHLASQITNKSNQGDNQRHQPTNHHGTAETLRIGVELRHQHGIWTYGYIGIIGNEFVQTFVGGIKRIHIVETYGDMVGVLHTTVVEADAWASIGISDTAYARIVEHSNDGVRSAVRRADDLLANSLIPASQLLHLLLELTTYHRLAHGVGLLGKRATGNHGDAHHVEVTVAHIKQVGNIHILFDIAGQEDIIATLSLGQVGIRCCNTFNA